jgi:hypothetical protein
MCVPRPSIVGILGTKVNHLFEWDLPIYSSRSSSLHCRHSECCCPIITLSQRVGDDPYRGRTLSVADGRRDAMARAGLRRLAVLIFSVRAVARIPHAYRRVGTWNAADAPFAFWRGLCIGLPESQTRMKTMHGIVVVRLCVQKSPQLIAARKLKNRYQIIEVLGQSRFLKLKQ